ncbi:DUF4363 family protein [Clostridium arbusti]|uniref:DUF4363 family protein n=1 Tax=Clostridium arbusti TaxID=1137848 RepID=UPI000288E468|nr:DUF4363 family protein [Clostridium arbusti]
MRKFFVIFIPVTFLVISILIMLSGQFFKNPRGDWDNVPKHMDMITKAVTSDEWTLAEQDTSELETAWKAIVKRVQFSSERDEINDLNISIARLKSSISSKDKVLSLMELSETRQHWEDLGK